MARTKTKIRQRITLPSVLVDILRWHLATQLTTPEQQASELLFPAEEGSFRSRSALKKPFVSVANAIGLKKHVSPKAMRRSFQDAMREAQVANVVVRSISGHLTEQMQQRYSTARGHEQESAIARIIDLTRLQRRVREAEGPRADSKSPGMDSKVDSIEGQHRVSG
jgi:site-specific recombinase XerC